MKKRKTAAFLEKESMDERGGRETSLNTVYFVRNSNHVIVELIYGDPGQSSSTVMHLDGIELEDGTPGDIVRNLGPGSGLDGKTLDITASVTDTSRTSNHTEMIVRLRGGATFREFVLSENVTEEGETVFYSAIIRFHGL